MELLFLLILWLFLGLLVGALASSRGRPSAPWFLLAVLISPLLAALLLVATRNLRREAEHNALLKTVSGGRRPGERAFVPDGVYLGLPYRVEDSGTITAMMPGGTVQFRTLEQFRAAASGETIEDDLPAEIITKYPQAFRDIRYRVERNGKVYTWRQGYGEKVYKNWRTFFDANHTA